MRRLPHEDDLKTKYDMAGACLLLSRANGCDDIRLKQRLYEALKEHALEMIMPEADLYRIYLALEKVSQDHTAVTTPRGSWMI